MTQSQALDILKMGKNVFLTGSAGTGKTYVINQYIDWLKQHGVAVAITASTGIAATHIKGQTIHSWSGLGIKDNLSEWDIDNLSQKEYLVKRWQSVQVLIIDEISMLSGDIFDSLDRLARAMKQDDEPFGGMQLVVVGDFYQLPPVGRGSNRPAYAFQSDAWRNSGIHSCYLQKSHRQDDDALLNILNSIRSGNFDESIYTTLGEQDEITVDDVQATRLYTHNVDVDEINNQELEKLDTDMHVFDMITTGAKKHIENITKGLLTPQRLGLKEGALVMFVKNNYEEGYVNGTLGTITEIRDGLPVVGTHDGRDIHVRHESWSIENDNGKVLAEVRQIPLRLAWAITVHKSQGMTLDAAEIDLSKAFTPGQGYVALSRVKSLSGLKLHGINQNALMMDPAVHDIDGMFQSGSEKLARRLDITPADKLKKIQDDFVVSVGGELDTKKVAKKKTDKKKSTYELTLELIGKKMDLKQMADERGCTTGTIVNHLQKLLDLGKIKHADIKQIRPDDKKIKKSMSELKNIIEDDPAIGLTALKKMFDDQFSFDELKVMMLFAGE
ncbi:MAG: AAA family ATPase [Candidatus Nomurabacteria bacterium]|nr:AAA family ATPase [Candidatus Nomurabacteria bacterium]